MTDQPTGVPEKTPLAREKELLLGRLAVRRRFLAPPKLVECLLIQSAGGAKRALGDILVEQRHLRPEQLRDLTQAVTGLRRPEEDEEPEPAPETAPDPRVGTIVAGVRLDSRLERAFNWSVYLGRRVNDPEPAAVKLLDNQALRRGLWLDFLETVRSCIALQSPNLTPVLDVSKVDGAFAIVTRYREGFSLSSLLERVRRIRLSEALRIGKEAAKGLRDLHRAGLVHRSFGPRSIWLAKRGEVTVQDAGIAMEPPGVRRIAERGVVFGLPWYIASEIARGELAEPRSDTYALGVILYEMATGVRPFEGLGIHDLMTQHLRDPILPPAQFLTDIPKPMSDFIVALLAKRKEDRPPDDDVVRELEALEVLVPKGTRRIDRPSTADGPPPQA